MRRRLRGLLTYANVMSTVAMFCVLGGTAYAAATIHSSDIVDGTIRGTDIATGAVSSADVRNGGIGGLDIALNAINGNKIKNGSVGSSDIKDGDIDSEDIENGSVGSTDIASGGIAETDLADDAISTRTMGNVPTVRIYHSVSQNVTLHGCCFNGDTVIWDSEAVDTDDMHAAANPSRITIQTPGVYMIIAHAHWNSDASNWYTAWIYKNGDKTNLLSQGNIGDTAGTDEIYEVTTIQTLVAGDYLEVAGNVEDGGPAAFYGGDKGSQFMATWLGPSS